MKDEDTFVFTTLVTQSTNPLYIFSCPGFWFINCVRIISKGVTVQAIKNPAPNAAKKSVTIPFGRAPDFFIKSRK